MNKVFVILTGAYGNTGDAVIRRRVLGWVRESGEVHAYVGNAPAGWIEELQLRQSEIAYKANQFRRWVRLLALSRRPILVLDPGQVPLSQRARKHELAFLVLTLVAKARGGIVIRPPRAFARNSDRLTIAIHRTGCKLSDLTLWRVPRCTDAMGVGRSTPDTAFQEALQIDNDLDRRSGVIISMRAKRDFPSDAWFAAIAQVVGDRKVITLSQVREDEDRSREIATRLSDLGADARLDPWGSRSDLEQERYVRALYGQSSLVISDRLHVLILASCAGSVPLEITEHAPSKAEEHFAAIGYTGVSLNLSQATGDAVAKFAIEAASRRASLTSLMLAAQAQLDAVESEIHGLIARKNISEVNNHQGARKK